MQLYHDIPKSKGVENALKRARQMVDINWVSTERFPSAIGSGRAEETPRVRLDYFMPPWCPRKGMPYSSVRREEKYLGYNVSFETFMTALSNPKSVLYTRSYHGDPEIWNTSSYYGIVCSCFGSYVCGFPYRTSGGAMIKDPDVVEVDTTRLENVELCDLVIRHEKRGNHVAVITDIQRDVEGKVQRITVSESVLPLCRAIEYTPELFHKHWLDTGYHVYRYAGVHQQTYEPSPYVYVDGDPDPELPPENKAFMSIFGDKANTRLDEAVEFTVFEKDWESVEVTAPDGTVTALTIENEAAVFTPVKAGFHTAVCRKGDAVSQAVNFCVTESTVTANAETAKKGGTLELTFRTAAPETPLLYIINRVEACTERQRGYFTAEEMAAGKATVTVNVAPGNYYVYTVAENEYGFYASTRCCFTVEEADDAV